MFTCASNESEYQMPPDLLLQLRWLWVFGTCSVFTCLGNGNEHRVVAWFSYLFKVHMNIGQPLDVQLCVKWWWDQVIAQYSFLFEVHIIIEWPSNAHNHLSKAWVSIAVWLGPEGLVLKNWAVTRSSSPQLLWENQSAIISSTAICTVFYSRKSRSLWLHLTRSHSTRSSNFIAL
jgi:hypothetical protein